MFIQTIHGSYGYMFISCFLCLLILSIGFQFGKPGHGAIGCEDAWQIRGGVLVG